ERGSRGRSHDHGARVILDEIRGLVERVGGGGEWLIGHVVDDVEGLGRGREKIEIGKRERFGGLCRRRRRRGVDDGVFFVDQRGRVARRRRLGSHRRPCL